MTKNEKKTEKLPLLQRLKNSGCFTPFYCTVMVLFVLSLAVYVVSRLSTSFAEFVTRHPANGLRFIISKLSSLIPFSVAEIFIVLLPIWFVLYLVYAFKHIKSESPQFGKKVLMPLVCVILVVLALFFTMFAPSYFRKGLDANLGLERTEVTKDDLYNTAVWLSDEIKPLLNQISFSKNGESYMKYDFNRLSELVNEAFTDYASDVDYISWFYTNPKPIALSEPFTYTHISGVYTFYTGEININTNYPDFVLPYTIAHEMSHQHGIAREEEANMVAFLVCMRSTDPYVKYSGLYNTLTYVENALYKADPELYKKYVQSYPKKLIGEDNAYRLFFKKYEESTAHNVSDAVNNAFLQSQGQQHGTKSYGLVVDLTVAYYKSLAK